MEEIKHRFGITCYCWRAYSHPDICRFVIECIGIRKPDIFKKRYLWNIFIWKRYSKNIMTNRYWIGGIRSLVSMLKQELFSPAAQLCTCKVPKELHYYLTKNSFCKALLWAYYSFPCKLLSYGYKWLIARQEPFRPQVIELGLSSPG